MKCNIVSTAMSGYGELRLEFGLLHPLPPKTIFCCEMKDDYVLENYKKMFFHIWGL